MEIPTSQRIIAILWPSFLTACFATVLFFAVFDPLELLSATAFGDTSRLGAYTIGFFLFWVLAAVSSALTCYFLRPTAGR
ncbi:MAG: hypothetical protein OEU36_04830 [Gammaproteobacteria bacterium]|nr:hypothetical protein [Gammaproteobacteria bacterium]